MANSFYMDASALAKRYIPEKGNELVDEILNKVPSSRIHFLNIGAGGNSVRPRPQAKRGHPFDCELPASRC